MRFDLIVIGAGAAGLAAARDASAAGKRVCLIEARDRIGGRVFTIRPGGVTLPIELGAEFIHGEADATFSIVDAAALVVAQLPDTHWWSQDGRWSLVPDFWESVGEVISKIRPRKRDISFEAFLRSLKGLSARRRELVHGFVEGYHAAHADRISATALRRADSEQDQNDPGGNRQFRILGGYDTALTWLGAGLDPERTEIRLSSPVREVRWSRGSIEVATRGGDTIRGRAAIVTIPLGVWKAPRDAEGSIAFDPALKAKEEAISRLETGHVVKMAFRFRERFWEESDFLRARTSERDLARGLPLNFIHAASPLAQTWWTTAPVRSSVLVAWAGGHAADALLAESPDARVGRMLDGIAGAFSVRRRLLNTLLEGTWSHDWQSDPFSRGAYSYLGVGGSGAHEALARPIERTLFFAGEATSPDQTGTVAGAIASGRRAAREYLRGQ